MSRYSRESLEQSIWRITGRALTASQVDKLLAEAEKYVSAELSRLTPGQLRARLRLAEAAEENARSDKGRARRTA